jgi:hypothetical protein
VYKKKIFEDGILSSKNSINFSKKKEALKLSNSPKAVKIQ